MCENYPISMCNITTHVNDHTYLLYRWLVMASSQYKKQAKISRGPTYTLPLSFTVISDVDKSFVPHWTTFTKYCLTQWISKPPGSFEIHRVRHHQKNFTGFAGTLNATVYKTKPIYTGFRYWKLTISKHCYHVLVIIQQLSNGAYINFGF